MTNNYPAIWITSKRLEEIRGETWRQVQYCRDNLWIEGVHYKKIKKGAKFVYYYNIAEIDEWVNKQSMGAA